MNNKLNKERNTFCNITYVCFSMNYNDWDLNIYDNDKNVIKNDIKYNFPLFLGTIILYNSTIT